MRVEEIKGYRFEIDTNWTAEAVLRNTVIEIYMQHEETGTKVFMQSLPRETWQWEGHIWEIEDFIEECFELYKEIYLTATM